MSIWNVIISSSLSGWKAVTATFALRHLLFSPWWKKRRHETVEQSRGRAWLIAVWRRWIIWRPIERILHLMSLSPQWSSRPCSPPIPGTPGSVGEALKKKRMEAKTLRKKWEEYQVAEQREVDLQRGTAGHMKAAAWKGSRRRWRRTAEHNICSERASDHVGLASIAAEWSMSYLLPSRYSLFRLQTHNSRSCVTVISIFSFIRNGPRLNPSSIYIFLQPFNVPCVQNQNQSVQLLVPAKVLYL